MSQTTAKPKPSPNPKPHHLGHRQRLRERFLKHPDAIADYELLELLLFAAIPRGDTKPLAKDLIAKFNSLAEVLSASPAELQSVKGVGEAVVVAIKTAQNCGFRMLQNTVKNKTVIGNWKNLLDYCYAKMAWRKTEEVRILYLNASNELIADEQSREGTIDHAPVYAREIVKRALELHASSIIMVHNHPAGDPEPSREDIIITKAVQKALASVDISLHDHLIIGRDGHKSLKSSGVL